MILNRRNKQQRPRFSVRYIIQLKDILKVLIISKQSCIPLTKNDLIYYLGGDGSHGFVVVENNTKRIAGFIIYEKTKSGFHIPYLVVRPSMRRKGAGKEMISHIIRKLIICGSSLVTINVRETNLGAQLFLKSQEFDATDILHKFYCNGENAYFMERCIYDEINYKGNTCVNRITAY